MRAESCRFAYLKPLYYCQLIQSSMDVRAVQAALFAYVWVHVSLSWCPILSDSHSIGGGCDPIAGTLLPWIARLIGNACSSQQQQQQQLQQIADSSSGRFLSVNEAEKSRMYNNNLLSVACCRYRCPKLSSNHDHLYHIHLFHLTSLAFQRASSLGPGLRRWSLPIQSVEWTQICPTYQVYELEESSWAFAKAKHPNYPKRL